ncbi:MAG: hypothetical protein PHU80_04315 [Kiritimatiellae bacterium]|nr:hypothetical protein [Kiritimatiellia bacterium]
MYKTITALVCVAALAASAQNMPKAAALPPEALKMREAYLAELTKIAGEYDAALLPMAENYLLELRGLAIRLTGLKDTTGTESARKEAARFMKALGNDPDPFETVPELPDDVLVDVPSALRLTQQEYAARRTAADLLRNEKVIALADKYISGLDRLVAHFEQANQTQQAAASKKEATRMRVAMQRKDFANRAFEEAGAKYRLVPPMPDIANLKERAAEPEPIVQKLSALSLVDLPAVIQAYLMKPLEYDKDWPPEITKWRYEGAGNYSHDFSLYNLPGMPDELGIFAYPKTMRAYVRGTVRHSTLNFDNKAVSWLGKGMSWRLNDSRDLVCKIIYRTKRPALKEDNGPAACVAVYSIDESDRLIASMSVPMLEEETQVRVAKHYSYNRLNIVWEGSKRKRGFTIPNHMPMRVVVGVVGYAPGEEIDATIEIVPCGPLGDMW